MLQNFKLTIITSVSEAVDFSGFAAATDTVFYMLYVLLSVRKQYIDLLNSNPRLAISEYDYEISQRCEQLIKSEPTFADLRGSVGMLKFSIFIINHPLISSSHHVQIDNKKFPALNFI